MCKHIFPTKYKQKTCRFNYIYLLKNLIFYIYYGQIIFKVIRGIIMGQIKVVIYDCDGVIVNSDNAILKYYSWLAEVSGVSMPDFSDEKFKRIVLSYTEDGIIDVISNGNDSIKSKLYHTIKTVPYQSGFEDIIMEPTLKNGLEIVKQHGVAMAVDTNRGRSLSELLIYFNIREYFSYLVTSRDVENPKPNPEGVYKICEFYSVEPREVLFIGDSMTDYQAAKSSGANFLAYKNTLNEAPIIFDHKDVEKYLI